MATIDDIYDILKDIYSTLNGMHNLGTSARGTQGGTQGVTGAGTGSNGNNGNGGGRQLSKGLIKGIERGIISMIEMEKNFRLNAIKKQQVELNTTSELLKRQLEVYGNALAKATENMTNTIFGKVIDNAYNAANTVLSSGKEQLKKNIADRITLLNRDLELRKISNENAKMMLNAASDITRSLTGLPNAMGATMQVISGLVNIANKGAVAEMDIAIARQTLYKEAETRYKELYETTINALGEINKSYIELGKKTTDLVVKMNDAAYQLGRSFGLTGKQLEEFEVSVAKMNIVMSELGMNYENYTKMQSGYISSTGRNIQLDATNALNIGALSQIYNLSEQEASQIVGAMEIFNISVDSGANMMKEMYITANKMGISNQKFAKDIEKNLKLVQRYTFRDGVEGMMKMAQWAQRVRFNMDELGSSLSKLHTGNIEDIIKQSAGLNVLGGSAAIFSDPFGMLFDAYNDAASYAERIKSSISEFGTYNKQTGETQYSTVDIMRMERIANLYGVTVENLMNMGRQEGKNQYLDQNYNMARFGEYADLIRNTAQFDKDSGKYTINIRDDKSPTGFRRMALDDKEIMDNLNNIFPSDTQEQLVDLAKDQLSVLKIIAGVETKGQGELALRSQEAVKGDALRMAENQRVTYEEKMDEFTKAVALVSDKTVEYQALVNKTAVNLSALNTYYELMGEAYKDMLSQIDDTRNIAKGFIAGTTTASNFMKGGAKNLTENMASKPYIGKFGGNVTDMYKTMNMDERGMFKDMLNDREVVEAYGKGLYRAFRRNQVEMVDGIIKYTEKGANELQYDRPGIKAGDVVQPKKSYKAHDVIITPSGRFELDPRDTIVASKPGGSLDMAAQQQYNAPTKLEVSGRLTLESNGQSIDLMELVKNNPSLIRELTTLILSQASNNNGYGRASKHYALPNFWGTNS